MIDFRWSCRAHVLFKITRALLACLFLWRPGIMSALALFAKVRIVCERLEFNLGSSTSAANFLCTSTIFYFFNRCDLANPLQVLLAQANQRCVSGLCIV